LSHLSSSAAEAAQLHGSPAPAHGVGVAALGDKSARDRAGVGAGGSSIWSWVWWLGNPEGPGPYTGGVAGGLDLCVWHDAGSSLRALDGALAEAGLPPSFWQTPRSGGHPGIWAVDLWAGRLLLRGDAADHFDFVACPRADQVPPTGAGVESDLPPDRTPEGRLRHLWIFWDTVPDPRNPDLMPLIEMALSRTRLPSPVISTSPSSIDAFEDATIVNFPTWFWINPSAWRTVSATAAGGGLVATVWATPTKVTWRSAWSLPTERDDPEGGVTLLPENLYLVCAGPGTAYDRSLPAGAQATKCASVFTQSTFGTYQRLEASISWRIHWALSDEAGVVGGEGFLAASQSAGRRPLRVLQVESVITGG
jgi:hypothetical protein